jgi:hypothetical protein
MIHDSFLHDLKWMYISPFVDLYVPAQGSPTYHASGCNTFRLYVIFWAREAPMGSSLGGAFTTAVVIICDTLTLAFTTRNTAPVLDLTRGTFVDAVDT